MLSDRNPPMTPSKTDPRVLRTRRLLREALVQLMEERGMDNFSVQELADQATIKRATFYLHYEDKQALLDEYIGELLQELRDAVSSSEADDEGFDYLRGVPHPSFVKLFHHIAERYSVYYAMLVRNRVPQLASGMLKVIHDFVSDGMAFAQPDDSLLTARREVAVKYAEAAILEVVIWWIEKQMPYEERDIASQLMNLSILGPYKVLPQQKPRT